MKCNLRNRNKAEVKVITGLFWGDEGKGKIAGILSKKADTVIRATGGNNAGHTVVYNGIKYALHLVPSSIFYKNVKSIIAPGTVLDLKVLTEEIQMIQQKGHLFDERLFISHAAHIICPHHIHLDFIYEDMKKNKVGTTGRGIGPCYESKVRRTGLRMEDLLLAEDNLRNKIEEELQPYHAICRDRNLNSITIEETLAYCNKYKEYLIKYICNVQNITSKTVEEKGVIVLEGAQALYLDIDHGNYPMVTSSSPNASGTLSAAGLGPIDVTDIIGIIKAYCSRVGNGPFVTELDDEIGDRIRELGHEFGTTTGRPRRCGWLDLILLKNACRINSTTAIAMNHVDTIGKLPTIQVCVAYELENGEITTEIPINLYNVKPIYKTFEGNWSVEGCKTFEDLPEKAKKYIEFIEEFINVPIKYIGTGPADTDLIVREE